MTDPMDGPKTTAGPAGAGAKELSPSVSVVIPAYNEEKAITSCLASLCAQDFKAPFEVIVVDNNSSDRTAESANDFRSQLDLRVVKEPLQGRGNARRTGFAAATGEIVCSTDADACLPRDWITSLTLALESDEAAVAVSGPCRIEDGPRWKRATFDLIQYVFKPLFRILFGHHWLGGFNFAIRKSAYLDAGEFDAEIDGQEDVDLSFRVHELGTILDAKDVRVTFSGRRFESGFVQALASYVALFFNVFVFKRTHKRLSNVR